MARADWFPLADLDLDKIFDDIVRRDNRPRIARRVLAAIRNHCDEYASHAARGHVLGTDRSDIAPGLRTFPHQRWIVLFRIEDKNLLVLAVVDGSREYSSLFLDRVKSG